MAKKTPEPVANPDTGWRKAAVAIGGLAALAYGVHPAVGAIDGQIFLYGVMGIVAGYTGINVYQHRWFGPRGQERKR